MTAMQYNSKKLYYDIIQLIKVDSMKAAPNAEVKCKMREHINAKYCIASRLTD